MPYNLGVYLLEKLNIQSLYMARALSATIGLIAVLSFYFIVRRWHNLRISVFATVMFATSSWFLHATRLADPQAAILLILPLIASAAWLNDTKRRGVLPVALAGLTSALLLYVPGLLWFVVLGLFWQRKRLLRAFRAMKQTELLCIVSASLIIILPGILAIFNDPNFALRLLGLPTELISFREIGHNALQVLKEIFVNGPDSTTYWIGSMPLLDAFAGVMFIIGLYSYRRRLRLDRAKLLLFGLLIGLLLVSLGGVGTMTLMLPFVYLVIAAGISFMMQQWFLVFPRNPIARTLGATLITIAVIASSTYNLSHYFVAWSKAPETRDTFTRHL